MVVMSKNELLVHMDDFINERGQFYNFKEWLEDKIDEDVDDQDIIDLVDEARGSS